MARTAASKRTVTKPTGRKKPVHRDIEALCKIALDQVNQNVLMCDRNLTITYANKTSLKKLRELEGEIRKTIPSFSAEMVVGANIDQFHKHPERQRRILENPANFPHRADIQIGPLTLSLLVNAVMSDSGEYLGNMVEWEDVTERRKLERERAILTTAIENAGTNIMIADAEDKVIFVNKAAVTTLKKVEGDLRQYLPGFDLERVMGGSIHRYHKNPDAIRDILRRLGPGDVRKGEITPGNLYFVHQTRGIFDDKGQKLGHMVEWRDATAEKKAQAEVERLIKAAGAGQLSDRIDAEQFEGFFKVLSGGVNRMLDAVVTPLHEAQHVLGALAQGDLTLEMSGAYEGEFEKMKASLNTAIQNLTRTVTAVQEAVTTVAGGTAQISQGNEDLSQRTTEQASALEETSASMEQMTATVKQNADNAKQANQLACAAREVAEKGGKVTTQAVNAMAEINKSSKKIADIITVIDEIAFQTNLLALNAAVEAARAGEHGRGFAVVAAEVRNLAQRSATAAKEIKGLINESVQRVTDGTNLVNQTGQTLEEIVGSVKRVSDIVAEISAASQEQAGGINQINTAITQMSQTTQENTALVEEVSSASESLKEQGDALQRQVSFFKTGETSAQEAPVRAAAALPKAVVKAADRKPAAMPTRSRQLVGAGAGTPKAEGNGRMKDRDQFEEF
jgi:methyl-accepting chemotaxis protein